MRKTTAITFFITCLICSKITLGQKDSTADNQRLIGPIFVYQDGELYNHYPVTYTKLSKSEWKYKNTGQEPSFLLSETPSVTVYSDAGSYQGYSYYRIRGIDQTRINMTLNGVPLNEPEDQGVYFSNYPDFLSSVWSLQIQRGVGTSQNGTSSYGGSMQFFSAPTDTMHTQVGINYGSFNSYRAFGQFASGDLFRKTRFKIRASHLHSDGYKERSTNTSTSVFYSGQMYLLKSRLRLTGFIGNQKNEMAWLGVSLDTINNNPRANANSVENDVFTQSHTQLQHLLITGKRSIVTTTLYYNYLNGNYDFDFNNFLGLPSTDELYNYAFESHFSGLMSNFTRFNKNGKWVTGIHGNIYNRRHLGSELNLGELYRNKGFKNEFSAFSKLQYILWGAVNLYADVQYRYTEFSYDGTTDFEKMNWNFINPKAGISWTPLKRRYKLYYSIGSTGREPTRNDLFGGADDLGTDDLGMPLLVITDPERVIDHELGFRYGSKKFSLRVNGYFMSFNNEIVLSGQFGPNGLALTSSVDKSIRTGVELSISYQPVKALKFVNNSSFNYSKIQQSSETFTPILTPALIVNQEIIYERKKFQTGLTYRYQSSSFIDFANENSLDGYHLLNLRFNYRTKRMLFGLLINNLTNTRYFNNGYVDFDGTNKYFIQAPINYRIMMTYTF